MKKVFLVAAAFIFGSTVYAQTTTTSSTSASKFGLKAGVNLPKYQFTDDDANTSNDTESAVNFHVTGYADVPLSEMFSVQPGISLQGKGAKYRNGNNELTENVLAVEIPLNFVLNVPAGPGKFFLGAGPYAGFNVAGQLKGEGSFFGINYEGETDMNIGNDSGDDIKPIDFGFNFLTGYQFSSGFNIGAGYGLGLTNLRPGSTSATNVEKNNRVLSFSVGVAF